jgi:AcrR family transcriptional regulator
MTSANRSPRVVARIADSRRRILEAARDVVAEQGFAAAQVAVVARVADVATGSVYRHFPSKVSLFSEMLRSVCQRELDVVQAIAAEPGRSCAARIGDAVTAFVDRALRGEGLACAVIVEPMDPGIDRVRLEARARLATAFSALIAEGIERGEFLDQDPVIRGPAIVGAMLEGIVAPLATREAQEIDRDGIAAEIASFCVSALAKPSERAASSATARRRSHSAISRNQETGAQ